MTIYVLKKLLLWHWELKCCWKKGIVWKRRKRLEWWIVNIEWEIVPNSLQYYKSFLLKSAIINLTAATQPHFNFTTAITIVIVVDITFKFTSTTLQQKNHHNTVINKMTTTQSTTVQYMPITTTIVKKQYIFFAASIPNLLTILAQHSCRGIWLYCREYDYTS